MTFLILPPLRTRMFLFDSCSHNVEVHDRLLINDSKTRSQTKKHTVIKSPLYYDQAMGLKLIWYGTTTSNGIHDGSIVHNFYWNPLLSTSCKKISMRRCTKRISDDKQGYIVDFCFVQEGVCSLFYQFPFSNGDFDPVKFAELCVVNH